MPSEFIYLFNIQRENNIKIEDYFETFELLGHQITRLKEETDNEDKIREFHFIHHKMAPSNQLPEIIYHGEGEILKVTKCQISDEHWLSIKNDVIDIEAIYVDFYGKTDNIDMEWIEKNAPIAEEYLIEMLKHPQEKQTAYSRLLNRGVYIYKRCLEAAGLILYGEFPSNSTICNICHKKKSDHQSETTHQFIPKRFHLLTGDTDSEQRNEILSIFNSLENNCGDLISILLISDFAEVGLNLISVRRMHFLEKCGKPHFLWYKFCWC
ncbi:hypothetical protein P9112_009952 [Eukaryota sp. TZLM1-RC]